MATSQTSSAIHTVKRKARANCLPGPGQDGGSAPLHASVLDEARRAGLLDGEKSEHVSFRAPPALVEAAKREAGISSTSELGVLALAMLARPDPVAAFLPAHRRAARPRPQP